MNPITETTTAATDAPIRGTNQQTATTNARASAYSPRPESSIMTKAADEADVTRMNMPVR